VALLRRVRAVVFAGDQRVWRGALVVGIPLVLLVAFYCVRPRDYFTGTNSVEPATYVAQASSGQPLCVRGLRLPGHTARLRFQLISETSTRPVLRLNLHEGGHTAVIRLPATNVGPSRTSGPTFSIREAAVAHAASLCLRARGVVNWAGTPASTGPAGTPPPTLSGAPLAGRIAIWYLPRVGARRSYLSRLGKILARASLFRPALIGPWLYVLILFVVLPLLAVASLRCLALAVARPAGLRLGPSIYAIAAINFACWALITPAFQAPDEVDHFAYTQSLVEHGHAPSQSPSSPLLRWSTSEGVALEGTSFATDHQVGDSRPPWEARQEHEYLAGRVKLRPSAGNGGGNETAATHGPIYYGALAPAYAAASSSPFDQLTLMRLTSALIGALTVLFAYLLGRELAPEQPWIGVLTALLVAFQPMFGFISGAVNNDTGVNAGAAALELLLIRGLRRGLTVRWGLVTAAVLILLPLVKGTSYALYPVAAIAFAAILWRHHRRSDAPAWAALVLVGVGLRLLSTQLGGVFRPSSGTSAATVEAGTVAGSTSAAFANPLGYLAYLWQVFLPRLSFMAPHFESVSWPAFVIFDERGWGAFGWYDVFFPHWVYVVLVVAMLGAVALALIAALRNRAFVLLNALELLILVLVPIAVVAGVEAAFYTPGSRPIVAEFGRYVFPAIVPLALVPVAALFVFRPRHAVYAGAGLLVAMIALSYAGQLTTLTGFFA
jgi:hypothetical protein